MMLDGLTPVKYYAKEGVWIKHDDEFKVCGVAGGKSRSAYQLIQQLLEYGYTTIVTAGSRQSPQCEIVSYICEELGVDCKLFMPFGGDTSVINHIKANTHTELIRVRPGYNNVIIARAKEYASNKGCGYIPFGMECYENVEVTSKQVLNLPHDCDRVVVPVGSGMSIASVITGMYRCNINKPILGVRVGKDPMKTIEEYAEGIDFLNVSIVQSSVDYHTPVEAYIGDYQLDPIYEGKCLEFLGPGDCLWVVGRRLLD